MTYKIDLPFFETWLKMPDTTYNELKPVNLYFEEENITEKGRMIVLGGGFVLICPEKEFEVINE